MVGGPPTRDDRVLPYTRGLSLFIAPFLLVAFVILYLFPERTEQLWAWTIKPTMTSMVLASAYLGGFYFFVRMLREQRWAAARVGFAAVALFATLLGIATILHWDRFNHGHVAFWLWAGLYFVAPFLVVAAWVLNQRVAAAPAKDEPRLTAATTWAVGITGVVGLATGIAMFVVPTLMIDVWPWLLTPLTCRVVGAVFCLGSALVGVLLDRRWITIRLMLQVEIIMVALILLAAVRARDQFFTDRPLTWLMFAGFVVVLAGSVYLWLTHRSVADPPRP